MTYPPEDGHPSKYSLGLMLINFVDPTNVVNQAAKRWCAVR